MKRRNGLCHSHGGSTFSSLRRAASTAVAAGAAVMLSAGFGLHASGNGTAGPFEFQGAAGPSAQKSLNLRATRLSERSLLISGGVQDVNVTAIRTSRGIILIDSGDSLEMGRGIRALLSREFPGAAVTRVVNTHAHWDHVLGNPAFPEATIVGQENCLKAMVRFQGPFGEGEGREGRPPAGVEGIPPPAGIPPPPPRSPLEVHLTPDVYALTVPDVTFPDALSFRDGDVDVELVYYGPAHTLSDLLALLPGEKLLFVGDLYYRKTLPSFSAHVPPDVARWRRALDRVLDPPGRFDRAVSGHGGVIPRAELEAQVEYLFEVWKRAGQAVRAGRSLESLQEELRLERAFPGLAALDVRASTGGSVHEGNVRNAFKHQSEAARSGAGILQTLQQVPDLSTDGLSGSRTRFP